MTANRDWVRFSHFFAYIVASFLSHKIFPYVVGHTLFKHESLAEIIRWFVHGSLIEIVVFIFFGTVINLKLLSLLRPPFVVFSGCLLGAAVSGFLYPTNGNWLFSLAALDEENLNYVDLVKFFFILAAILAPKWLMIVAGKRATGRSIR